VFGLQVRDLAFVHNKGVIFALNMIDEVQRFSHHIDTDKFSQDLDCAVFALSAKHPQDFVPQITNDTSPHC
jgi:ferrous iron transport protein B